MLKAVPLKPLKRGKAHIHHHSHIKGSSNGAAGLPLKVDPIQSGRCVELTTTTAASAHLFGRLVRLVTQENKEWLHVWKKRRVIFKEDWDGGYDL